jgi:predicted porin
MYATTRINGQSYTTHTRLDNNIAYWMPEGKEGFYGTIAYAPGEGVVGNRLAGGFLGFKVGTANLRVGYSRTQVNTGDVEHSGVGLAYGFGAAQVLASVTQLKLNDARERHFTLGTTLPVGVGTIRAAYLLSEGKGGAFEADRRTDRTQKIAVGYQYDLSKRTLLYTTAAYLKNKGGATYVVGAGPAIGSGTTSKGMDVGIRHVF